MLDQVYSIMLKCWDIHPENRPKFFDLQVDLDNFQLTGDLIGYSSAPLHTKEHFANLEIGRSFSTRIGNEPLSSLIN